MLNITGCFYLLFYKISYGRNIRRNIRTNFFRIIRNRMGRNSWIDVKESLINALILLNLWVHPDAKGFIRQADTEDVVKNWIAIIFVSVFIFCSLKFLTSN
jgi:hypothetical protein